MDERVGQPGNLRPCILVVSYIGVVLLLAGAVGLIWLAAILWALLSRLPMCLMMSSCVFLFQGYRRYRLAIVITAAVLAWTGIHAQAAAPGAAKPSITQISPPEKEFFTKKVVYKGLPIKAPAVVVDEALYAAYDRLDMMLHNLPAIVSNLVKAGVELHIIGRNQVTTDLPEWRHDKGKKLAEYNGLTRDERTRGMGGQLVSCGEENLLRLETDHYRGRDICQHEFAHAVRDYGMSQETRAQFDAQYRRSLAAGLWQGAYAGSNPDEFFAELTMWYFGTHGDEAMKGLKPGNGPAGLKKYDPDAFKLMDNFYSGCISPGWAKPTVASSSLRRRSRSALYSASFFSHSCGVKTSQ